MSLHEEFSTSQNMNEPVPKVGKNINQQNDKDSKTTKNSKATKNPKKEKNIEVKIWQVYAELYHYKPKMWRRFLIPDNLTMGELASVIMTMFRMEDKHLWSFQIPSNRNKIEVLGYKEERSEFTDFLMAMRCKQPPKKHYAFRTKMKKVISEENKKFQFLYDFGDDWEIKLKIEKFDVDVDASKTQVPQVLKGEGYGILEDCGGIGGLLEIREVLIEKSGEEYENLCEWLDTNELNLDAFNVDQINELLSTT